jgi:hypothetical protein
MEVGWYLRFGQAREIRVLASKSGAAQIRHHVGPDFGWSVNTEPEGDHFLVTLRREAR